MDRRQFLLATTLSGATIAGLSACGGSGGQGNPAGGSVEPGVWTVVPPPVLILGAPDIVFDLQASLPAGVRRGGRFDVSPAGAPLPTGVVLQPSGVLSVTSAATEGVTVGVVFAYEEPS
jgi:hypothetical protein